MKTQKAINEFLQSRYAGNLKPSSLGWYRVPLEQLAALCPKLPTKPGPIETFLSRLSGSPETKHAKYTALKTFFTFISGRHRIPNPMKRITPPRRPKMVTPTLELHEAMLLLNSATKARDRAMLTLLIDSGIRASELANLRRHDIKTETIQVRGKTGEREVPISEETRQLLALVALDSGDEYVFNGHKGPLTRYGIYRIVSTHMRKAGITGPKLGPHRIRHAFGKGYLVSGGDVRSLQQIMGHANITTTQKYAALTLTDTIAKHHKFTPLRAAHAAAQESFFDTAQAIKEAEDIVTGKGHA